MSDLNTELIYEFLSREGVSNLSKSLLTKVNARIQERIVSTIDETSGENHVPSAAAVFNAINKMSHIKFKTHTGSIDDLIDPNPSYIYLQRDDDTDTTWMMYLYDAEHGWINIGDTEVNLSNYWSKSAEDIEALKLALGISDNNATIEDIKRVDEKIDQLEADLRDTIKNLPANLLFNQDGDFAINLRASMETSLVDYMFGLQKRGMYTIYAERGCPDNPISEVDSSFRGICHITQLEDDTISSGSTGTQKMYGWIMLFDQEANVHVNYIRRSVASGWKTLGAGGALSEEELNNLKLALDDKVSHSQMVKLTNEEIQAAVESAYTETAPVL